MEINPATSTSTSNSASSALSGDMGDMFLKLLTTQLKEQDPLSPMDPTAFVGQLVQFNTLGEIMKIRELLQSAATPQTTSVQSATPETQPVSAKGAN